MPGMGGLELLEKIAELKANVLTVIMTGFGTVETAIEAMKKGAYDYILKPFKIEEVVHVVERGLDRQRLQAENIRLKEAVSLYKISEAIAQSLSLDTVLDLILDAVLVEAQADVATLLLQDPRTGLFVERTRRHGAAAPTAASSASVNLAEVLEHYRADRPLLAHGITALQVLRRAAQGQAAGVVLLDPAQGAGPRDRHAQRVLVHARQQVLRGPAQDALGAGVARRGVDRERAALRRSGQQEPRPGARRTSRWRRTSAPPSSASRTRSRSRTSTRAATPSASPSTRR